MNSMKDLWDSVLKRLSGELSETTINTWFDEVTVVTMEDSAFVLHCSNTFKKNTIEARFLPHIKAALKDLFSTDLEVKILDDDQLAAYHGVAPDRPGDLSESQAFTFETYVVGPQNKLAFAAAKAVTEKPGENYNPLFIYGDSGLGKTHLLYAIANALRKKRPDARIVYVKGDDFTNELIAYAGTEGYVPVTSKAQSSDAYQDYLARSGEDNSTHYDVKIMASKLLLDNTQNTFVTPVYNGSASLRSAAGQMIEEVTKAAQVVMPGQTAASQAFRR